MADDPPPALANLCKLAGLDLAEVQGDLEDRSNPAHPNTGAIGHVTSTSRNEHIYDTRGGKHPGVVPPCHLFEYA